MPGFALGAVLAARLAADAAGLSSDRRVLHRAVAVRRVLCALVRYLQTSPYGSAAVFVKEEGLIGLVRCAATAKMR